MRILLLAMPDTASSLDRVMKFPNLGLCSIAAQVPEHGRSNGYMANVRTRHLSSAEIARAMLWEGLKLYYDPRAARQSRFFRDFPGSGARCSGTTWRCSRRRGTACSTRPTRCRRDPGACECS